MFLFFNVYENKIKYDVLFLNKRFFFSFFLFKRKKNAD